MSERGFRRAQPNFIYIGPDKAGSSWLHEVLLRHPQVFMPEAKDLYFFDRYYDRGPSWYLGQFLPAGPLHKVVGEVCQDYLFHPQAAARMRETLGAEVRTMVTFRDPADRAFSSYLYALKQGEQHGTFLEALGSARLGLLEHGRYASKLQPFLDVFGRERLHVAVFDDLVEDPQGFVDGVLDFLSIAPMSLPEDLLAARLLAGRARSVRVSRLVRRASDLARARGAANVIGKIKRSSYVQRALYTPLTDDKPVMTTEERMAVQRALAFEVAALDRLFGLGLARRWGWVQPAAPTHTTGEQEAR